MNDLTARDILELLRFRRLDRHNGSMAGDEPAVRFCGEVAELIERLMRLEPVPPRHIPSHEHWLFVCSANMVRSPTAEYVARRAGYFATSAGIRRKTTFSGGTVVVPLTQLHLRWAHVIVCMEQEHVDYVREHPESIAGKPVYCWDLPDIGWNPFDADLVKLCEDHFAASLEDYRESIRGHSQTS